MAEDQEDVMQSDEKPDPKEAKEKKTKKKSPSKKDGEEGSINNKIEINPKLNEAVSRTIVFSFGRMNPVTIGHEKLVNKVNAEAKKNNATPAVYLSHSQDAKKNPLSYNDKLRIAQKAFGKVIKKSNAKTIIQIMQEIEKSYNKAILIVGADRVKEFETLLSRYNGKDYNLDSITVMSAGERDPDAEGVEGMSASKMRAAASAGDKDAFISGLPKKLKRNGEDVYNMVRGGMKLAEELEAQGLLGEALDIAQRRARAITMRKYKSKIAMARKRMMKRPASAEKIKKRAQKKALAIVKAKVAGKKGADYSNLSVAEKQIIDKKVQKRKALIQRLAKKLVPKVRMADRAKLSGKKKKVNEEFEVFFEARQDADIKDREGTQPAKYHAGLSKSTKEKRDAHFKKGAKMDDDNDAAYKPAPGDADAKTKESKHTKKYKAMYGEESEVKRYHEARKKDGTVKLDARLRPFRNKKLDESPLSAAKNRLTTTHKKERENLSREHEAELDNLKTRGLRKQIRDVNTESFESDESILAFIEEVSDDILASIDLDEAKAMDGLKKKAEKSGISYGILKKVYDRGVAAWRTGHRPGTTPQQWGYARVNSFVTKSSGTWGKADKDLAAKVRKEEVELDEAKNAAQQAAIAISKKERGEAPVEKKKDGNSYVKEEDPCWDGYKQVGMKKKGGKMVPNCVKEEIFTLDEQFELQFLDEEVVLDRALAAIHKHVGMGKDLGDMSFEVSRAAGVKFSAQDLRKKYIQKYGNPKKVKLNPNAIKNMKKRFGFKEFKEAYGAGFEGTDTLVQNYKEVTPGESGKKKEPKVSDWSPHMKDEKSKKINESFENLMEAECQLIGMKQIKEFERVVDNLFKKFGIDFQFTKHFGDRMSDGRNDPCITLKELAAFVKKIYANQGKSLKGVAGAEAVVKDIQTDLNIPVAVKYDQRNDEFDVVMKTIMRKKNFKTPDKVITYK